MDKKSKVKTNNAEYRRKTRDNIRFSNTIALGNYSQHCRVLDVGSLDGRLQHFLPGNVEYNAIDMDECDLNTQSLPFKDDEFDYVFSLEILEHLYRPLESLREFARVGRNVILSVPNPLYLQDIYRHLFHWKDEPDWGHINSFLYCNIELMCRNCDLKIVKETTTSFLSFPMPIRLFSRHQVFLLERTR